MYKLKKFFILIGMTALPWFVTPQALAKNLKVVSTFSILSDFAEIVGGNRIALTTLIGPNGDAHAYEPRPADATAIRNADLILANGLHLEGFLQRLIKASGTTAPVVEVSKGATLLPNSDDDPDDHEDHAHDDDDHDHHHDHGQGQEQGHAEGHHHHGKYDPHAWQSVHNAKIYVNNIAEAFCAADKEACPGYRANAGSYGEKLDVLEKEIKAAVAQIPPTQRTIITSHDAFGYFGHAYGLRFLAPQGLSTDSEASAAGIAALIQQIKKQKASALFVENISNPRLVEQISKETGMKIGGKLYSDALSAQSGPAATYIDMMRHNVTTIRDAIIAP